MLSPGHPGAASRGACQASAATIESAALAYFAGHDATWPPDIAALTDATPPYFRNAPDPKWASSTTTPPVRSTRPPAANSEAAPTNGSLAELVHRLSNPDLRAGVFSLTSNLVPE
jgi:hypothetical protein